MGVKSLWTLLEPVGRPVPLETMEGKAMAIDSSIWIYQFQATMRDKEGRGLVNAHVVGFLRRICKLLFYGIKPVFVFDGGAPALKRATIAERKSKKSGAAASHAKIAERLLAAQLRREALNQVQSSKRKGKDAAVTINEDTVYLEDLDPTVSQTPKKQTKPRSRVEATPPSAKKSRWQDHDPYKLPDVDLEAKIAQATRSNVPDPRLATEDELRAFIEEMKPEDFDVSSPAFRELPTEVQYEIIGDLRLKSRQTSYKRLQNMLRNSKSALDFSKEQIKNLKQRNSLTQQLLITTDSIGKAHVEIPIRIASERNKQYVLVKNEGAEGGWILGVKDEGTRAKPIEIDQDPLPQVVEDEESDDDMEEVPISIPPTPVEDPDLREYRRSVALNALAQRYTPKKAVGLSPNEPVRRNRRAKPLFNLEQDDPDAVVLQDESEDDELEMSAAIHASLESQEEQELRQAMELSRSEHVRHSAYSDKGASSSKTTLDSMPPITSLTPRNTAPKQTTDITQESDEDDLDVSPNRLETALRFANASPAKKPQSQTRTSFGASGVDTLFGTPSLLLPGASVVADAQSSQGGQSESDDAMEEVAIVEQRAASPVSIPSREETVDVSPESGQPAPVDVFQSSSDDDDMEEIPALPANAAPATAIVEDIVERTRTTPQPLDRLSPLNAENTTSLRQASPGTPLTHRTPSPVPLPLPEKPILRESSAVEDDRESDSDDGSQPWSRPPSPQHDLNDDSAQASQPSKAAAEDWDAAQEMDPQAEEGEFAKFMSQVRGKDLESIRREIDEEIKSLNQQRKVAMRDSEDITQSMISQIMMLLRLFGIPYITAPMEAEAQCAELLSLTLVDGIITDDSDVFLFGGSRVFKNMFNQSKTVECFRLSDLERELGLDRDKLIRLAYLLGSDYTEGLPGVGPVVAMELLTEFPGTDGLHKFAEWWRKVQSGRDKPDDNRSKFRKRFKKRFKDLYLPDDWPNPAVRDAYYHPTVDKSEEPFKWGLPDLDALRDYLNTELGWDHAKVDETLLPIIQKVNKRSQQGAVTRQDNLNAFFDVPTGGGVPRKRQAYSSKRLQQVVSDFRKKQRAGSISAQSQANSESGNDDESANERPKKKRKSNAKSGASAGRGRGRGRGARGTGTKRTASKTADVDASDSEVQGTGPVTAEDARTPAESRPRPKPRPRRKPQADDEEFVPS
ncbi:PIN domain-like protein [Panus rudis PR-1116 ss-1]|nr:PIN domain-like protein [Panus rudis PR-1116 ss-1]